MQTTSSTKDKLCLFDNAKVAIYGTGSESIRISSLLKNIRPDVQIMFYIDSFKEGTFNNKKVVKADSLKNAIERYDLIIIASAYYEEIEKNLKKMGIHNYLISKTNLDIIDPQIIPTDVRSNAHKKDTNANYIKIQRCPICYGTNSQHTDYDEIVHCPDCGHTYVESIPDLESTIARSYSTIDYWYQDKEHQNLHEICVGLEWDFFINARMNDLNNIDFLDGLDIAQSKILEIGCSEGMLVKHLNDIGYNAFGLEVNPEISEKAISELCVPIINKPIEHMHIRNESIDRIISYHTFEHLVYPRKALEICANALKHGGKLLLNVPIDDGEFGNLDHYHFFSLESITYLMQQYFVDVNYKIDTYMTSNGTRFNGILIYGTKP